MSVPSARPAWYALERGSWRDYVTLLHLPYTAWHLSYVVIGGCLAPVVAWGRLGAAVVAFALAVGVGAHALDELNGRPLRTAIPSRVLVGLAAVSITAACAIGLVGALVVRAVARRSSSRRALPRPRVQPRALRWPLPLRPLVRARLGRLPRGLRVRGGRRRASTSRRCSRLRSPSCCRSPSGRSRITSASCAVGSRASRGELELATARRDSSTPAPLIAAEERGLRLLAAASVVLAAALVAFRI